MSIVAAACGVALAAAAPAAATGVRVITTYKAGGAVGLLVPGKGPTVSREEALKALDLGSPRCPCPITISVSLPPPGRHHNVTRYPIAIAGGGYHGLLVSSHTHVPGLISVFDVPETVRALENGKKPPITSRPDAHATETLFRLNERLTRAHDARDPAMLLTVSLLVAFGLAGAFLRSAFFARTAVLVFPVALGASLVLSAAGAERPTVVVTALGLMTVLGSLVGSALLRNPKALGAAFVLLLLACLVVMWKWPVTNSLAVTGPHPDGGGRFYGATNEVSTFLLAPSLLAAALLGRRWLLPVAALALITVGASFSGADGGGAASLLAGFVALGLQLYGYRLTVRALVLVGAVAIALGLAFVGLDAALGGSSHVTHAVGGGPGRILHDLGHRLRASWDTATGSWYHLLVLFIAASGYTWAATRKPRWTVVNAMFVALVVSLLVNDSPVDVAGFGALSTMTLASWRQLDRRLD
jgi:hypothetical protein